jgi:hypothetical protein
MSTDSDIRSGLQALAERAGPPSLDGDDLARLVVREEISRRRRQRGLVAVAAAVVAIVTAVPLAVDRSSAPPDVAAPVLRPADIYGVPTRGSLAGDAEFVEAARQASWQPEWTDDDLPDPPVETRRVVFAGIVGDRSVALVVGENTAADPAGDPDQASPLAAAWFMGGAEDLQVYATPWGIAEDSPIGLVTLDGALVVVGAPGDAVEVSERPEIAADGTVSRSYAPVETDDGVAVHEFDRSGVTSVPRWLAVSFRVLRDGALVVTSAPDRPSTEVTAAVGLRMTATREPGAHADVAEHVARNVLTRLGITDLTPDVEITTQWAGPVPGANRTSAALVTVTVPSGAVVVAAGVQVSAPDGGFAASDCAFDVRPAGTPAEDRVYAASCPALSTTGPGSLVVVGPARMASVRVHHTNGAVVSEYPAEDGVAVVDEPRGVVSVEALTGSGVSYGRSTVLGVVDVLAD